MPHGAVSGVPAPPRGGITATCNETHRDEAFAVNHRDEPRLKLAGDRGRIYGDGDPASGARPRTCVGIAVGGRSGDVCSCGSFASGSASSSGSLDAS